MDSVRLARTAGIVIFTTFIVVFLVFFVVMFVYIGPQIASERENALREAEQECKDTIQEKGWEFMKWEKHDKHFNCYGYNGETVVQLWSIGG